MTLWKYDEWPNLKGNVNVNIGTNIKNFLLFETIFSAREQWTVSGAQEKFNGGTVERLCITVSSLSTMQSVRNGLESLWKTKFIVSAQLRNVSQQIQHELLCDKVAKTANIAFGSSILLNDEDCATVQPNTCSEGHDHNQAHLDNDSAC